MAFEFKSIGPKGTISKIVNISETNLKGLYNHGFGDKDSNTGTLNDLSISYNGDSDKVLATVVATVYALLIITPITTFMLPAAQRPEQDFIELAYLNIQ